MKSRHEWMLGTGHDEPRHVAERFEELARAHEVPDDIVFKFQLALDEILTNVVSYAFGGSEPEENSEAPEPAVRVVLNLSDSRIMARVEDNGVAFDPLSESSDPDLDLSAEERDIGGLGIHLTKAFVETLGYERRDGWNCLTLVQPIAAHTEENA